MKDTNVYTSYKSDENLNISEMTSFSDDDEEIVEEDYSNELDDNGESMAIEYDEESDFEKDINVEFNEPNELILSFKSHVEPVHCCAFHPNQEMAISSGEDDVAYIWNTENGQQIFKVEGHYDTIIGAGFSPDGKYLYAGDMTGEIEVYTTIDFEKIWNTSIGNDLSWVKWHKSRTILMAGTNEGEIYICRIKTHEFKVLPGFGSGCYAAQLTNDGMRLLAGYSDGSIRLWDIKSQSHIMDIQNNNHNGHSKAVISVDCHPFKELYISGGEDESVLLLNKNGVVMKLLANAGPVEVVTFCPNQGLDIAVSGTLHGKLAIWDISRLMLRNLIHLERSAITCLKWLQEFTIVCGTHCGCLVAYDCRNGEKKFDIQAHLSVIYELDYNPIKNTLLTASEDNSVKIFRIPS